MQKVVQDLVRVVGLGDAIEIVSRWGGRDWYVPCKIERGDALSLTLGQKTAAALVENFGGQYLQLPIERNALLDLRNQKIVEDAAAGMSHENIGLAYGISRQQVSRIIANGNGGGK